MKRSCLPVHYIIKCKTGNHLEVKDLIKSCLQRNRSSEKLLYELYVAPMARICPCL